MSQQLSNTSRTISDDGLYYIDPKLDANGDPVFDADGNLILVYTPITKQTTETTKSLESLQSEMSARLEIQSQHLVDFTNAESIVAARPQQVIDENDKISAIQALIDLYN